MASKTRIYIVLEFVNGGELFDKIVIGGVFLASHFILLTESCVFVISFWFLLIRLAMEG